MRDTRLAFIFFGLLPAFNAAGLFIYSIYLVTGGRGSTGAALIVTLLSVLVMLAAVLYAGVRRARDMGWSGGTTFVVFAIATFLVFPLPLLLLWLALAPGKGGEAGSTSTSVARVLALVLLMGMPWMLVLVARAVG